MKDIIKENKNLKEENKELKIKVKELENELLKVNKGYHLGFIDGGIAKRYEYEDKIKAKIEEVSNGTYDAKIVLESLLEKENENKWKMKK